MSIQFQAFSKDQRNLGKSFHYVGSIALKLRLCLDRDEAQHEIKKRHVVGASSSSIQDVILRDAVALGFKSEKRSLFNNYLVAQLRPNYFMPIGDTGIILEVERGKSITNNMDLLDMWKCHICSHASYLFLLVPIERPSENRRKVRAFYEASRRLAPFFEPRNYVNVDAVFLYGY